MVATFTDSTLYGAEGKIIEDVSDLEGYDKHKVYSQSGALLGLVDKA